MLQSGNRVEGKLPERNRALDSLREFRRAIEYGFFRQETVSLPPIHEQNVVDTCHTGWMPLAFKEAIMEWISHVKESTNLAGEALAFYRQGVMERYGGVRYHTRYSTGLISFGQ